MGSPVIATERTSTGMTDAFSYGPLAVEVEPAPAFPPRRRTLPDTRCQVAGAGRRGYARADGDRTRGGHPPHARAVRAALRRRPLRRVGRPVHPRRALPRHGLDPRAGAPRSRPGSSGAQATRAREAATRCFAPVIDVGDDGGAACGLDRLPVLRPRPARSPRPAATTTSWSLGDDGRWRFIAARDRVPGRRARAEAAAGLGPRPEVRRVAGAPGSRRRRTRRRGRRSRSASRGGAAVRSRNTTDFGFLYDAIFARTCSMSSSSVAVLAVVEHDDGPHRLAPRRVGHADHRRLAHRGVGAAARPRPRRGRCSRRPT